MAVTVSGSNGQSLTTLNLSTSDLTGILASASPTLAPILYDVVPVVPTVSATLTVPTSLSSTVINVSGLSTPVSVATGTGVDTVSSGTLLVSAAVTPTPTVTAATGTDTMGLVNTVLNSVQLNFMPTTSTTTSVAGGLVTTSITGGATTTNAAAATASVSRSNETLTGGIVPQTFNLSMDTTPGSGAGITDTITHFNGLDTLNLGGSAANNMALSTYQVTGGSGSFSLPDGTKVVLQGYTNPLSTINLTH